MDLYLKITDIKMSVIIFIIKYILFELKKKDKYSIIDLLFTKEIKDGRNINSKGFEENF